MVEGAFLVPTLCPGPHVLYPKHLPHLLASPTPQIAEKVGCPVDDTSRMAKCLKITDPRALTLAYKMPLTGTECEWGAGRGRGASGSGEGTLLERRGSPGLRPGPATARWCP